MDWNKAKSILIAALLATDLIIGGIYLGRVKRENEQLAGYAVSTAEYLQQQGIDVDCEIPTGQEKLPALELEFSQGLVEAGFERTEYKGTALEFSGSRTEYIKEIKADKNRIELQPAAAALLRELPDLRGAGESSIKEIELIYFIDRSDYAGAAGEDTALPYWKIIGGSGKAYYCPAFTE